MNYGFDIIGDIHGHSGRLVELLEKMDYEKHGGVYRHPERRAIFLGDFVDRGPDIVGTVNIARNMVEKGSAQALMGNHEYNAICFNTPLPGGDFARPHTIDNIMHHAETLKQYQKKHGRNAGDMWRKDLDWFQTLPLFMDLPDTRLVHACWDEKDISLIKNNYKDGLLSRSDIVEVETDCENELSLAVIQTLKGKEYDLTQINESLSFFDPDGTERTKTRLKWWHENKGDTVRLVDMLFDLPEDMHDQTAPWSDFENPENDKDERPLFFGHYWLKGQPRIISGNKACLDFSVAKNGVLTAYRFNGEKTLSDKNLVWV